MLLVHAVLVGVLGFLRVGGEPLCAGVGVHLSRDKLRWIDWGLGGR